MKIKNLIKGAFVYGTINIIQKSVTIFLIPIYLATLSVEEYGALEIIIAIYAFFALLFMLQMEGGFQRFFYDHEDPLKSKLYLSSHLYFVGFVHIIGAGFLYLGSRYFLSNMFLSMSINKALFIKEAINNGKKSFDG